MTEIFRRTRVTQAWLAAIRHLAQVQAKEERNIILEISHPQLALAEDQEIIAKVDAALKQVRPDKSVMTAAATIFPERLYRRYKRPEWYDRYKKIIDRGMPRGTWGTYVLRMIERKETNGVLFNPLEEIIKKLASMSNNGRNHIKANYEVGISDPAVDIELSLNGTGFELPTYNPALDRRKIMGNPCLSHVTFKLMDGKIDLTAIYRSHYYAQRALGNLIGLAQLQEYVAKESGFEVGVLTCISTYAKFDDGLGGIKTVEDLLSKMPADETTL